MVLTIAIIYALFCRKKFYPSPPPPPPQYLTQTPFSCPFYLYIRHNEEFVEQKKKRLVTSITKLFRF